PSRAGKAGIARFWPLPRGESRNCADSNDSRQADDKFLCSRLGGQQTPPVNGDSDVVIGPAQPEPAGDLRTIKRLYRHAHHPARLIKPAIARMRAFIALKSQLSLVGVIIEVFGQLDQLL